MWASSHLMKILYTCTIPQLNFNILPADSTTFYNLLSRHDQFQKPKAEIDLLSPGYSYLLENLGEPVYPTKPETWNLFQLYFPLPTLHPEETGWSWDNPMVGEMFHVWSFPPPDAEFVYLHNLSTEFQLPTALSFISTPAGSKAFCLDMNSFRNPKRT